MRLSGNANAECLQAGEADAVMSSWMTAMNTKETVSALQSVTSFARTIAGRRLKKQVRCFADRHSQMGM